MNQFESKFWIFWSRELISIKIFLGFLSRESIWIKFQKSILCHELICINSCKAILWVMCWVKSKLSETELNRIKHWVVSMSALSAFPEWWRLSGLDSTVRPCVFLPCDSALFSSFASPTWSSFRPFCKFGRDGCSRLSSGAEHWSRKPGVVSSILTGGRVFGAPRAGSHRP